MNKLFNKIAVGIVSITMAVGVGVAIGSGKDAARVEAAVGSLVYTLSGTTTGSGSAYGSAHKVTQSSIDWYVTGNVEMNPWRIGGKSISNINRPIYSATAINDNIAQIEVVSGSTASSLTVNSLTISVHSSADDAASGSNVVATKTVTSGIAGSTVTFTKADSTSWAGKYFRIVYNVTRSSSSGNGYITFSSAKFYKEQEYTISYNSNGGSGSMSSTTGTNPAVAACTFNAPDGKQFSHWNTSSTDSGDTYSVGDTPKKNLALYAIWEDKPSTPYVNLTLTSGSPAYKGTTVTVSASSGNLEGSGLTWTVTGGTVTGISSSNTSFTGTLASAGTITITAQDNGGDTHDSVSVTVNAVTVTLNESSATVPQKGSLTLTATVNVGSVIWSSNSAKVTVTADSQDALKGIVSVAADATVGSTATITATSTVDGTVCPTCTITVSEDPFSTFTKVTSSSQISSSAVYALSYEGTYWAGNTVSSSQIASATDITDVGFFRLESTTDGYFLKFVVKNAQTGQYEDAPGNKYINNSSSTSLSSSNTNAGASVWAANNDSTYGVILQNTDNSNRFLGWNNTAASSSTVVKAYSTTNLHAGNNNAPLYLYEVPQNKLDGLTLSNQTTTFTAGTPFTLGNNAVLTAHYSQTGNTTDLSGGTVSYTINNQTVTTSTPLEHDKHNGKTVVVTYTDAAGDSASITGYTITVNYKPATGISLNQTTVSPLAINNTVELTATVTDSYADPNDVTWETTDAGIASISAASGTKTITVTGVSAGTATITAMANGHYATCSITVSADPLLNIKDSGGNIINNVTFNHYTGESSVTIHAYSENIDSPVYNWSNDNNNVVTISTDNEYCTVTFVGAGSSEVSVTAGSLTRKVIYNVSQSGVTSLTLTSSVPTGEIYDGTYNNTLTLTPEITKVGAATSVVNWLSSDPTVATVSSASTTAPTAITVTGVGAGTATITATSDYTPSVTATFNVTVIGDGVTSLSWTKRPKFNSSASGFQTIWAGETTLGDLMSQNGSDGIGVFAPTWKSSKSDSPTMGTGTHNVHIGLYDVSGPTSETTPLTSDYVFTNADNNKYVVAFYEGKASTNNTQLSITKWRSVIESAEISSTITWSSSSATVTGDVEADVTNVQYTYYESNSLRLGTGSGGGQLRIETDSNITSVVVTAKAYSDSRKGNLTVGDHVLSVTNTDYVEFDEIILDTPTDSLLLSTPSSNVRINIQSIVITCSGEQQIGKTSDCLGLETFIDTYLHMSDYTSEQGWCSDDTHHYYSTLKAAFNDNEILSDRQRALFVGNSAYTAEYARLCAWAAANGDSLNAQNKLSAVRISSLFNADITKNNSLIVVIIISVISAAAIGGYFFLRKKKED